MKFVCLGYYDEAKFANMPPEQGQKMMEECLAYDDELRRNGHFAGGEALESFKKARTLRAENGEVIVTDGPFTETKESLGGILFLEARDMDHAVALMSKHPGVRFGPWEIRPANAEIAAINAARDAAVHRDERC